MRERACWLWGREHAGYGGESMLVMRERACWLWGRDNPAVQDYGQDYDPRGVKNTDFSKSLGMVSPGVENVGGPWGSILKLSRASQLPYSNTKQQMSQQKQIICPKYVSVYFDTPDIPLGG